MPKTKISEFDVDPANNTDINSINIAEGCAPSGINNAIRQLMSDLKEFQTGAGGDPFNGAVNGTVGATTPASGAFTTLSASGAFSANGGATLGDASGDALTINSSAVSIPNGLNFDSNTFVIDAGNNAVGIGTSSPDRKLMLLVSPSAASDDGYKLSDGTRTSAFVRTGSSYSYRSVSANTSMLYSSNTLALLADGTSNLTFHNGIGETMRIDSSGNVGIGISNPSAKLHIGGNTLVPIANSYYCYTSDFGIGTPDSDSLQIFAGSGNAIRFGQRVSGTFTERMRLDSSGNLLVGTTVVSTSNLNGTAIRTFSGGSYVEVAHNTSAVSGNDYATFRYNGTSIGSIVQNGTTQVTYATSSDYRLKENVAPMTGALATVQALKPCTYTWKADGSSGQGFIAHELQAVVPDCVTGEKDAVDAEGKPVYQGIDTSFLVATLTAAIQEQQAIITDLKSRIETLENK